MDSIYLSLSFIGNPFRLIRQMQARGKSFILVVPLLPFPRDNVLIPSFPLQLIRVSYLPEEFRLT